MQAISRTAAAHWFSPIGVCREGPASLSVESRWLRFWPRSGSTGRVSEHHPSYRPNRLRAHRSQAANPPNPPSGRRDFMLGAWPSPLVESTGTPADARPLRSNPGHISEPGGRPKYRTICTDQLCPVPGADDGTAVVQPVVWFGSSVFHSSSVTMVRDSATAWMASSGAWPETAMMRFGVACQAIPFHSPS